MFSALEGKSESVVKDDALVKVRCVDRHPSRVARADINPSHHLYHLPLPHPPTAPHLACHRYAGIGAGAVSAFHHVPGINLDARAKLVMVCDPFEALLKKREQEWAPVRITKDYMDVVKDPEVDAVIVATPNDSHFEICMACIAEGAPAAALSNPRRGPTAGPAFCIA